MTDRCFAPDAGQRPAYLADGVAARGLRAETVDVVLLRRMPAGGRRTQRDGVAAGVLRAENADAVLRRRMPARGRRTQRTASLRGCFVLKTLTRCYGAGCRTSAAHPMRRWVRRWVRRPLAGCRRRRPGTRAGRQAGSALPGPPLSLRLAPAASRHRAGCRPEAGVPSGTASLRGCFVLKTLTRCYCA